MKKNKTIVFFGDSVTDCNHLTFPSFEGVGNFDGLGFGYVMMIATELRAKDQTLNYKFINSGIGGNRIYDLEERFEKDVLSHKPDVVSFLVGINDTWRRYDSGTVSSIEDFSASYRRMLTKLKDANIPVIICEPFLQNVPSDRSSWREDLSPRIDAIRQIAIDFSAVYVPLDGIFASKAAQISPEILLPDGVHPSLLGHKIIAQAWLDHVETKGIL